MPSFTDNLCSPRSICMTLKSKNIGWEWHVRGDTIKVDLRKTKLTRKRFLTSILRTRKWIKYEERKNQQDATIRCSLVTSVSTCFGHHYAHLQENKDRVTAYGVLLWFCWMWSVAPHNRYQPHPAEPEQHTKCSNRAFVLLKMGIMMPETCWDRS